MQIMVSGTRKSITAPTMTECKKKALALIDTDVCAESYTVAQLIDRYIEERSNILSPSTIAGYKNIKRNRFPGIMKMKADKLTPSALQKAINAEAGKDIAEKTIRSAYGLVTHVVEVYTGKEIKCALPQKKPHAHQFLEPEQIKPFIDYFKDTKCETAVLLGLHGLRMSEIIGLTELDYDRKNNSIRIRSALVKDENNVLQRKTTKTVGSTRTVPILIPRLTQLLDAPGSLPVTVSQSTLYKAIMKACEEQGIPNIGVHGLRHSFASLCAHLSIPERETMKMGGWSSPKIMEEVYTHIAESDKQKHENALKTFFA